MYRPQLVCAACSTLFQQWTGINTIIFYAPQLFLSLGVSPAAAPCTERIECCGYACMRACPSQNLVVVPVYFAEGCVSLTARVSRTQGSRTDSLIATVVVGLCNHFSTYASFWLADHFGRRFLFIEVSPIFPCSFSTCPAMGPALPSASKMMVG